MMAAERRVLDAVDPAFANASSNSLPPMTAKRKIHSEDDPLPAPTNPPKRAKKTGNSKRGGLMIVPVIDPGPSSRLGVSSLPPLSRQSSRAPSPLLARPLSPNSQPVPFRASSLQPPPVSRTLASTFATTRQPPSATRAPAPIPTPISTKGKERQSSAPPAPLSATRSSVPLDVFDSRDVPVRGRSTSRPPVEMVPLPSRETPLIEKNRELRNQATQRRRSSLDHRRRTSETLGKNGSISDTGDGALSAADVPHPDVASTQYHRHISTEVSAAQRTRQLLVWSSSRTQLGATPSSQSQPGTPTGSKPGTPPDLPNLSIHSTQSLKKVQELIVRMLAEGSIDTAPSSQDKGKDKARDDGKKLRPNPMNEKNRLRIQAWKSYCDRATAENQLWIQLEASAKAQLAKVAAETPEGHSTPRRKVKKPPEEWIPGLMDSVDERWRQAAQLAQSTIALDKLDSTSVIDSALDELLQGVELHVDELEDMLNTSYEITHRAESLLRKFFATVSTNLGPRLGFIHSRSAHQQDHRAMSLIQILSGPNANSNTNSKDTTFEPRVDSVFAGLKSLSSGRIVPSSSSSSLSLLNGGGGLRNGNVGGGGLTVVRDMEIGIERKMTAVPPRTPGKDRAKTPRRGSTPGRSVHGKR